jgi:hypothetical protein
VKNSKKMIILEFNEIGPNQLDEWLYVISKHWKKIGDWDSGGLE